MLHSTYSKPCQPPNSERGIALILVLGVLSMLLVLALAFAFTARTDRAAAGINTDLTKARLLAKSGLERAIAYLSFTYPSSDLTITPASNDIYPATKAAAGGGIFQTSAVAGWVGHRFFVSQNATPDFIGIERAVGLNLGFDYTPAVNPGGASWQHIMADEDGDGSSDEIIGRIAFVVIDESGKIDPSAVVNWREPYIDLDASGDHSGTEPFYDWVAPAGGHNNGPIAEGDEQRWGYHPSEINIEDAYPSGITAAAVTPNEFRTAIPTVVGTDPIWFSWRQMLNTMTTLDAAEAVSLSKVLFPHSQDTETYWTAAVTPAQARFDLSQDWSAATIASVQAGIPFLTTIVPAPPAAVRNQVTANLIDYCDADSWPTHDCNYPGVPLSAATATYVGLEMVPYINEIVFDAQQSLVTAPDDRQLDVNITVELINIYNANVVGGTLTVYVDYLPDLRDGTADATFIFAVGAMGPLTYATLSDSRQYNWTGLNQTFGIASIKAVLQDGDGRILDFASITNTDQTTHDLIDGTTAFGSAQVFDPRNNTSGTGAASNWRWVGFAAVANTTSPGRNSNGTWESNPSDPSAGLPADYEFDPEVTVDPGAAPGISTAYIRNAPMKSLWELGAIYRGEPWRTINLKKYGIVGDYASGDAIILDQVKLGPETEMYGKVNINSPVPETWKALLSNVFVGAVSYDQPETGSDASDAFLTPAQIGNAGSGLIKAILDNNGTQNSSNAKISRAALLGAAVGLSNGTIVPQQDTDRAQEEIIGKMANLLTARQNYFRIIVTAQAVKDIGTASSVEGAINYAGANYCTILAEQKIMAIVYRDAYTNDYKVLRYEYLED